MRPDTVKSSALLREARLRAGLSQLELAERSGKGRVQIGRWEIGTVAPSLDTLIELIHACGLDLPLTLVELPRAVDDEPLTELQRMSPERRLDRMLDGLGSKTKAMSPARQPAFDPRAILASLERNGASYIIIGGLARVLRGAEEMTTGVDICPVRLPTASIASDVRSRS